MFHSRGTVQSRTEVPEGTSLIPRGMYRCRIASVCRTPLPVMLRQIGKSSWMSANMFSPSASERGEHSSTALLFCHKLKYSSDDGPINPLGSVLARWMTPGWTALRFDYTLLAQRLRNLSSLNVVNRQADAAKN